ncbi:MAG: hypothetical protein N2383_09640 [Caldilineales bacterium]|nr:hypothetical protein [Caldilineales bacterium]
MLDDIATSLRRIAEALERIERILQAMTSPVEENGMEESATEERYTIVDWAPPSEESPSELDLGLSQLADHGNQAAIQEAINWLESLNCTVLDYKVVSPEKELWDWFAMFLGNRFDNLQEFYEKWKISMNNKNSFELFLNNSRDTKISDNVQFASRLQEFSLISSYYYNRKTRRLMIIPLFTPEINNFVTGDWLEYYISRIIWNIINSRGNTSNFALLRDIKITLPNNQNTEIDLLVTKNSRKIWIECTSSRYQQSVENWRQISDYLDLPIEYKIAVALKSPNDSVTRYSFQQVARMTLLSLDELPSALSNLLS